MGTPNPFGPNVTVTFLPCPASGLLVTAISDGTDYMTGDGSVVSAASPNYVNGSLIPAGEPYSIILPSPGGVSRCPPNSNYNPNKTPTRPPPINVTSSVKAVRPPVASEITNVNFDPASNKWWATWTPRTPNVGTTDTYSNGTTKTTYTKTTGTLMMQGPSASGPWTYDVNNPTTPFNSGPYIGSLVALGASLFAGASDGVYVSFDVGLTFTKIPTSPTEVVQLTAWQNTLFAATMKGVYYSYDKGAHWTLLKPAPQLTYGIVQVPVPMVVPLTNAPMIIAGDGCFTVSGAEGQYATASSYGMPTFPPIATSTQSYIPDCVQPLYLGTINGVAYVAVPIQETSPSTKAGSNGYAFYSVSDASGVPVFAFGGYSLITNQGYPPTGGPFAYDDSAVTDPALSGWSGNWALSANGVVQIDGRTLGVAGMLYPGGPALTVNGVTV